MSVATISQQIAGWDGRTVGAILRNVSESQLFHAGTSAKPGMLWHQLDADGVADAMRAVGSLRKSTGGSTESLIMKASDGSLWTGRASAAKSHGVDMIGHPTVSKRFLYMDTPGLFLRGPVGRVESRHPDLMAVVGNHTGAVLHGEGSTGSVERLSRAIAQAQRLDR